MKPFFYVFAKATFKSSSFASILTHLKAYLISPVCVGYSEMSHSISHGRIVDLIYVLACSVDCEITP